MAYFNGTTWVSSTPAKSTLSTKTTKTVGSVGSTPTTNTTYSNKYGTTTYVQPVLSSSSSSSSGSSTKDWIGKDEAITNPQKIGVDYTIKTPTTTVTPSSGSSSSSNVSSGESYDYASAMLDALNAQYQAQENARIAKLNALKASNKESADRAIGQYNNQANKNARQIANLTKNGTNGAMLSQQLQNSLWRDNGIHSTLNTMNTANANGESASYDTQAENLGNLTNSINSLASTYLANMDTDSQRKFISRLQDLYK